MSVTNKIGNFIELSALILYLKRLQKSATCRHRVISHETVKFGTFQSAQIHQIMIT